MLDVNIQIIIRSPLLTNWSDRLWLYIKSAHEYDILRVLNLLHEGQKSHSTLIPGKSGVYLVYNSSFD
jgi:hypothetical protein